LSALYLGAERENGPLPRPQGYKDFDSGAAKKFVIDPHGSLGEAA
jgi:hypothetical protein